MNISLTKIKTLRHGPISGPWLTLGLTGLLTALYYNQWVPFELFVFDQKAIMQGEFWRFLTGHLVHCHFEHLFWDLVAFVILGSVIEMRAMRDMVGSLAMSCLAISIWLIFGQTEMATYCGLSGALNGLLVVAVMAQIEETGNRWYALVLVGTLAKILFEFLTHQTLFVSFSAQPMPGAHLAGFVAGGVYVLIQRKVKSKLSSLENRCYTLHNSSRQRTGL